MTLPDTLRVVLEYQVRPDGSEHVVVRGVFGPQDSLPARLPESTHGVTLTVLPSVPLAIPALQTMPPSSGGLPATAEGRSPAAIQVRHRVLWGFSRWYDRLRAVWRSGGDVGEIVGLMTEQILRSLFDPEGRPALRAYLKELDDDLS